MGRILDLYPHLKDWLMGTDICDFDKLEAFFDKYHISEKSILREAAREFVEEFCKQAKKPFRYYFKSKSSLAKMIGIDVRGRRFAVGRSGYRISTRWYRRFFPK